MIATQTEKGKVIYKALTLLILPGKQLILKHEATIASYLVKCLPDKDILLKLLSHSEKGF